MKWITFTLAMTNTDTQSMLEFPVFEVLEFSGIRYHKRHQTLSGPRVFVAPISLTACCPFLLSWNAEKTKYLYLKEL